LLPIYSWWLGVVSILSFFDRKCKTSYP
jgi:hypothetical protein